MRSWNCRNGKCLTCMGVVFIKNEADEKFWEVCICECHKERFERTGEYTFGPEHKKLKELKKLNKKNEKI